MPRKHESEFRTHWGRASTFRMGLCPDHPYYHGTTDHPYYHGATDHQRAPRQFYKGNTISGYRSSVYSDSAYFHKNTCSSFVKFQKNTCSVQKPFTLFRRKFSKN